MKKTYEFKASKPEVAIQKGLEELGLKEEDVEIEIVSHGGLFTKAVVQITPKVDVAETAKKTEEEETEEGQEEIITEAYENEEGEEEKKEEETPVEEENK